jgi:mycofactocin system glycosyltransferase
MSGLAQSADRLPGPWAVRLGYVANPPVRVIRLASGGLVTRDGEPRGLRVNAAALRALVALAPGGVFAGDIDRPEVLSHARVLDEMANVGLLRGVLQPVAAALPTVAVIVPAYGRPGAVARCIGSILELDYPRDRLDVVVVDDASRDDGVTARAAEAAGARVIRLPVNFGPGGARDVGARGTASEILAFVDSDCTVEGSWLVQAVAELAYPGVAAVAGRVQVRPTVGIVGAYEISQSPLDMGAAFGDLDPSGLRFFCPTANFVVRRVSYERIGGFDSAMRLGEDVDLCLRLLATGDRIRYRSDLVVWHDAPSTIVHVAERRFSYGKSEAYLWPRHEITRRGVVMSLGWLGLAAALMAAIATRRPRVVRGTIATAGLLTWWSESADGLAGSPRQTTQRSPTSAMIKNLARYQALPMLVGETVILGAAPVVSATVLVAAGLVERRERRPRLGIVPWLVIHAVEDVAYSSGVLRGALSPRILIGAILLRRSRVAAVR